MALLPIAVPLLTAVAFAPSPKAAPPFDAVVAAPTALEPKAISEEKNKVFRSMTPIDPQDVVRGQYVGYKDIPGVSPESDTETFVALKCTIDNWRWAGVPFYLRTGKKMAEGQRIISIAFKEPPKSMFAPGSGVGGVSGSETWMPTRTQNSSRPAGLTISSTRPGLSPAFLNV